MDHTELAAGAGSNAQLPLIFDKAGFRFGWEYTYVGFFSFQSQQAEKLGREDQQRLHRNRKLVLMVDLDQTLIHTTEQHCQRMSNKVSTPAPRGFPGARRA